MASHSRALFLPALCLLLLCIFSVPAGAPTDNNPVPPPGLAATLALPPPDSDGMFCLPLEQVLRLYEHSPTPKKRSKLELAADWSKVLGVCGMLGALLIWCQQRAWFPRWPWLEAVFEERPPPTPTPAPTPAPAPAPEAEPDAEPDAEPESEPEAEPTPRPPTPLRRRPRVTPRRGPPPDLGSLRPDSPRPDDRPLRHRTAFGEAPYQPAQPAQYARSSSAARENSPLHNVLYRQRTQPQVQRASDLNSQAQNQSGH